MKVECWIEDPDEVYIRGKIVAVNGDECQIESAKGVSQFRFH